MIPKRRFMLASLAFVMASVTATGQGSVGVPSTAVPTRASHTAQATDRDLEAIASWVAVDAATGYERRVAPTLASALGGWTF